MNHLGVVGAAVVASLVGLGASAGAQVGKPVPEGDQEIRPIARAVSGSVEGIVLDDLGAPVPRVAISALGATSAVALTDRSGRFRLRTLPPGPYIVRAHLAGFTPSRRQLVEVLPNTPAKVTLALRRADDHVTRILAAGMVPGGEEPRPGTTADPLDPSPAPAPEGDQTEVAWRLRHLKRSVLKSTSEYDGTAGGTAAGGSAAAPFMPDAPVRTAEIFGSSVRPAADLFGGLQLAGEFNLLTIGSLDNPAQLLSPGGFARGVAYVSIGGPVGQRADWTARAMMSQGNNGSWFLTGSYKRHEQATHVYDVGVSYASQRPFGGESESALAASQAPRIAGAVYGVDRWALADQVLLTYGGRYSRYGYVTGPGLFNPQVSLSIGPLDKLRIQAGASRRSLVPGAEEFLPPLAEGLWIPSGRTFSSFTPAEPLAVEHTEQYDVTLERSLAERCVIEFRAFYQRVTDQQATVFGIPVPVPAGVADSAEYHVGSAGDLAAQGWGIGLSGSAASHVRGSVRYEMTTARWRSDGDSALIALWAPSAVRGEDERFHDLTGSVETEIPWTATRFFVLYKINTAFARREREAARPGLDGRFDVQVTQSLPFMGFTSTDWEVLLAVRNMFRDSASDSSAYDELLVVRPPKRIVGGVLVRF